MEFRIDIPGLESLAHSINNLADALKAGAKASDVIEKARSTTRRKGQPEAPSVEPLAGGTTPQPQAAETEAPLSTSVEPAAVESQAADKPAAEVVVVSATSTAPADSGVTYKIEDVRAKLTGLVKAGKSDGVKALLAEFKAPSISALKAQDYPAVMAKAETL